MATAACTDFAASQEPTPMESLIAPFFSCHCWVACTSKAGKGASEDVRLLGTSYSSAGQTRSAGSKQEGKTLSITPSASLSALTMPLE